MKDCCQLGKTLNVLYRLTNVVGTMRVPRKTRRVLGWNGAWNGDEKRSLSRSFFGGGGGKKDCLLLAFTSIGSGEPHFHKTSFVGK